MKRADFMKKILGGTALIVLLSCPQAWANNNEARDLVAPYGHFPLATGAATGPFTTHYLISSTTGSGATVNVKCFNDTIQRVGPVGGTTVTLGPFEMEVWDPVSLNLTPDVNFTGFGWCYFAATVGDDIAVAFIAGISVGGNLITTNNSLAIMADTAQSQVTDGCGGGDCDANIPYWTKEGSWNTYLLAISPTTTGTNATMDVYNPAGVLLGTFTFPGTPDLQPRDLDFQSIPDSVGTAGFGHADISAADRGFVGWVAGLNFVSFQAFMYPVPLDKDDTDSLGPADRP